MHVNNTYFFTIETNCLHVQKGDVFQVLCILSMKEKEYYFVVFLHFHFSSLTADGSNNSVMPELGVQNLLLHDVCSSQLFRSCPQRDEL